MKTPRQVCQSTATALLLTAVVALVAACRQSNNGNSPGPSAQITTYAVTGVLHRVESDGVTAIIDHDLIPGYMMAMTMPFTAQDPREFQAINPGDEITFRLLVTTNDAWIDKVRPTGLQREIPAQPTGMDMDLEELDTADALPDCELVNDQGATFRLSGFEGRAVAFTFMFTRCPLPTYCPLMSRNFAEAWQLLSTAGQPTNWMLVSISFDPEFDSPAILNSYANTFRTDPSQWWFATADRPVVEGFGRQFGLQLLREPGTISHNLRTVVVDPNGRIHHVFRNNQWTPEELVAQVVAAAAVSPVPITVVPSSGDPATCRLTLTGLACDGCALAIQKSLQQADGVASATVSYTNRLAIVEDDPSLITPSAMAERIRGIGYGATPTETAP